MNSSQLFGEEELIPCVSPLSKAYLCNYCCALFCPPSTLLCVVQHHKSLFPDEQVPGFGADCSSVWEALEPVARLLMDAFEQMLSLPRGEEQRAAF